MDVFDDPTPLVRLYESGSSYVSSLTSASGVCDRIESGEFVVGQKLGEGAQGAVYLVHLAADEAKKFVMKRALLDDEDKGYATTEDGYLEDLAEQLAAVPGAPSTWAILARNGGDPERYLHEGDVIRVPLGARDCKITKDLFYDSNVTGDALVARKGSFICEDEARDEFFISLLVGLLLRKAGAQGGPTGTFCANFSQVYAFGTCMAAEEFRQPAYSPIEEFIFMEQLTGTFYDVSNGQFPAFRFSAELDLIQLLFSIAAYQKVYSLSHNDIHQRNIFFRELDAAASWSCRSGCEGERLADYDFFEYRLGGEGSLFIPRPDHLALLGDWGLACKWSDPQIVSGTVLRDERGGVIPNEYEPAYDVLCLLGAFANLFTKTGRFTDQAEVVRILADCCDVDVSDVQRRTKRFTSKWDEGFTTRPKLALLAQNPFKTVSALDLLVDDQFFGEYRARPASGRILLAGSI